MELQALIFTAVVTAVLHTLTGPDHYLPFIALGKSRDWSLGKTAVITAVAGVIHVLGTVALGLVFLWVAMDLQLLEGITEFRGTFASWALLGFGAVYTLWGLFHGLQHKGTRVHSHGSDSLMHRLARFLQGRVDPQKANLLVNVAVFAIFAFGPVEPLITLIMIPSAAFGLGTAVAISLVFLAAKTLTMVVMVLGSLKGLKFLPPVLHNQGHTLAGLTLVFSGTFMVLGF